MCRWKDRKIKQREKTAKVGGGNRIGINQRKKGKREGGTGNVWNICGKMGKIKK